ncbi:hypothetical protein ACHAWF_008528 [Thalassiosira exigua]
MLFTGYIFVLAVVSTFMIGSISAHSWLACTDYRGDVNYFSQEHCYGWARRWADRGSALTQPAAKGYQIAVESPDSPRAFASNGCDRPMATSGSWRDAYTNDFPHATYEQGNVYCIAWSMQNHATTPEDCDNPHAKSDPATTDSLALYVSSANPQQDPSQSEFLLRNINEVVGLAYVCHPEDPNYTKEAFCQLGLEQQTETCDCKGFQRSPAFCENTGSALGTGCFWLPDDFPTGHYVGQWYWNTTFDRSTFVQQIAYKTCFDFEVVESNGQDNSRPSPGTKGSPIGSLPCVNNMEIFESVLHTSLLVPTTSPILDEPSPYSPTTDQETNCSTLHQRCGGPAWNGPTCCLDGTECVELYEGWPQCMPSATFELPTMPPTFPEDTCASLWTRCGGEAWEGPTCCQEGDCIEQHPNWYVCIL